MTRRRWRTARIIGLAIVLIVAVSALGAYLTAPRGGGLLAADSTAPDGAHALLTLLRDQGIDVVVADDVDEVAAAARPDTLIAVAQTFFLLDGDVLDRLAALPGDRLLIAPSGVTRELLAPGIDVDGTAQFGGRPDCDLREAVTAGDVQLGFSDTFARADDGAATRCYDGALLRYQDGGRTVTLVGSGAFMTNAGLLGQGSAALAMNLSGTHQRVIWYAPQRIEGATTGSTSLVDLIPAQVGWAVVQIGLAVLLVAWWRARRLGPLVAERLPVAVRASETVEGRARLYRSRRARDRAAAALRTAALSRLRPRLGLGPRSSPDAIIHAVAGRTGADAQALSHTLFGTPPSTDEQLLALARQLDDIERQVAQS